MRGQKGGDGTLVVLDFQNLLRRVLSNLRKGCERGNAVLFEFRGRNQLLHVERLGEPTGRRGGAGLGKVSVGGTVGTIAAVTDGAVGFGVRHGHILPGGAADGAHDCEVIATCVWGGEAFQFYF